VVSERQGPATEAARTADKPGEPDERTARELVELVTAIAAELRPDRQGRPVTLDSVLDRDLGFDSLARTELLLRIERDFAVRLPEPAIVAETVRELLRELLAASGREAQQATRVRLPAGEAASSWPTAAGTLLEVLDWHLDTHPDRIHCHLYHEDRAQPISYRELHADASTVAAGLLDAGLAPGRAVAIMLPTGREYLASFLGTLLAGGIPVPIYPPLRPSQIEEHLRRHARILGSADAQLLVTVPDALPFARLLQAHVPALARVVAAASLLAVDTPAPRVYARPEDIALLQYTSGSTGQPKGVIVTHAQVLANLRAAIQRLEATPADVFVSWLPLYHDMGLIGAWLGSLYVGCELVLMSPLQFLARPSRWLWAVHAHRGTLSASPNFGYELCLRKIDDGEVEGLDLASWRFAMNGAEPVSPATLRAFIERYSAYGFSCGAAAPVYGLAESTLALTMPSSGTGLRVDRIERDRFRRDGRAVPAGSDDPNPLEFVACGHVLSGQELRVVNAFGVEVDERVEGRLQFRGNAATSGYYRNPEATAALFSGSWLDSGDRAYLVDGRLHITGRDKEIIIRGGRNIHPYELEETIGAIDGVRKGCVAVLGCGDANSGTEKLVVVAETRLKERERLDALRGRIEQETAGLIGAPPDDVTLAPPHAVLKTSSGKIRRAAMRELYESGEIGRAAGGLKWQLLRMGVFAIAPALGRFARGAGRMAFGLYALAATLTMAVAAALVLLIAPGLRRRWRIVSAMARALLAIVGMRLIVRGREHVPQDRPCVLVANHSSYVDAVVVLAALPRLVSFVAKAELKHTPVLGFLLRRMGIEYVERFDRRQSSEDAQRMAALAQRGRSLLFFPEGTFRRAPGLLPFRMGAFRAAAGAGLPLVPMVLRGTRAALPDRSLLPRRVTLTVRFLEPLTAAGSDWESAVALNRRARDAILACSGEPDIAADG
jgi:1-acyl-sn-glycerol-3-phosphate acyltransferase